MNRLLLIVSAAACLAGCGDSEKAPTPSAPLPPSAELHQKQEQYGMDARQQAGQRMNQDMAAAAKQMADAKAKSGAR